MTKHIEILSYIAHNYYRDFGYNTEKLVESYIEVDSNEKKEI